MIFLALGIASAFCVVYIYKLYQEKTEQAQRPAVTTVVNLPIYQEPKIEKVENALEEANLDSRTFSFSAAIAKVSPSVVNVYAQLQNRNDVVNIYGSGVIMTQDGYVLTNNHVIADATDFAITLVDGTVYRARLIGRDALTDLAVLKIITNNYAVLHPIKSIKTTNVKVGDVVIALGNPLNLGQSATMGIVSGLGRATVDKVGYQDLIQTDVALNVGNSGGALIDSYGNLIGINTLIVNQAYGQQVSGLGFAVPTSEALGIMKQIIEKGFAEHPYIGAQTTLMTDSRNNNYLVISYWKRIFG
ncbi:S1C family serine protease [Psittacicella gerlachiana]|uniref:S1C family serine protease n=1 Tax=Psittacicella gerlachiana TaxID=2028574 RepID=UPI001CA6FA50|nr:trypsin-like peptidase domain-containing protein [Psittacicella gerlachiana]